MKMPQAVIMLLFATAALADDYADARNALLAAYQAQDFGAMREAAGRALAARPGYPGALFNRAFAEVLDGDAQGALGTLGVLAAKGVDFGVAGIPGFGPVQALPGWDDYAASVAALNEPRGDATIAASYHVSDFVPEGIAVGDRGEVYLGSIRHGTIVRIHDEDVTTLSDAAGHWSVFGMRLDGDGGLWFASASVPEYAGANADPGRTGLFRLDLANGKIDAGALLPRGDEAVVLGDLVIADADTIYASESLTGAVYRYSISRQAFTAVVAPGTLRSAQGLVLDAGGESLYVADYVGGLYRVTLADQAVQPVTAPESVTLFGIDGLYRHGDELIAIQNGVRPHRVVAWTLSQDGLEVTKARTLASNLPAFDEPTLGAIRGDSFFFVANSHWNRFDRDGNLADGLSGPLVLETQLDD